MTDRFKKDGSRHRARGRAVDLLFEAESRGISPVDVARDQRAYSSEDDTIRPVNDFSMGIVEGVHENLDRIDDTIASHLQGWVLERLPAVDRAVLRIAVWELFYTDVPPVVAVDEAVELAKRLSTDESPSFINGVLGRIVTLAPQVRAAAAAVPAAERDSRGAGSGAPAVGEGADDRDSTGAGAGTAGPAGPATADAAHGRDDAGASPGTDSSV